MSYDTVMAIRDRVNSHQPKDENGVLLVEIVRMLVEVSTELREIRHMLARK